MNINHIFIVYQNQKKREQETVAKSQLGTAWDKMSSCSYLCQSISEIASLAHSVETVQESDR